MKYARKYFGIGSSRLAILIQVGGLLAAAWLPVYAASLYLSRSADGDWVFEFLAATGSVHSLEYTDDLRLTNGWQAVPLFTPIQGADAWVEHIKADTTTGATQRFFRVRSEPDEEAPPLPVLALFTFTGDTLEAEETHPQVSASPFGITSGNVTRPTDSASIWTGSGVPFARGSQNWDNSDPLNARAFTFTLQAQPDHFMSLDELSLLARATDAGPSALSVIVNDQLIYTTNMPSGTMTDQVIDLSEFAQLTQAVVRIAGWMNGSREASGSGRFEVDDILVRGTTEEIPADYVAPPSVGPGSATTYTESSAVLTANITQSGGAVVTERGFLWSTDPDFVPFESGSFVQEFGEFAAGTFTMALDDLPPGTTIYYYAYAVNEAGTTLSTLSAVTTLTDDVLAYYDFTGESRLPTARHTAVQAEAMQLSGSGSTTYGWVNPSDWQAMGAEEPYLSADGWTAKSQQSAKRYEINLMAENGWLFSVTGVTFLARANQAGPSAIGVSVNDSSAHIQNMPALEVIQVQATVTDAFDLDSARIDLQGWLNQTRESSGSGAYRIDNVQVSGFVSMVMTTAVPTVVLPTATNMVQDRALVGGTVTESGGSTILERGVAWSTNPDFSLPSGAFLVSESGTLGTFETQAYQLPPGTSIYYRAYARNATGYGYTELASFDTPNLADGVLAYYAFTGGKVVPHLRHPQVIGSHVSRTSGRPGIAWQNPAEWTGSGVPYAQLSGGFNTASPYSGQYLIFMLEAVPGTTFTVTNVQYRARANEAGPSAVSLLIDHQHVAATDLPAEQVVEMETAVTTSTPSERLTLRIAGWQNQSRSTSGTGVLQIDDIVIQGTVDGTPLTTDTNGVPLRIASVNVYDGIAEPGDPDHDALRAILIRMDADVVAFQELFESQLVTMQQLATDLGYPHTVLAPSAGISGTQRVGFFSRYPLEAEVISTPPDANELTRGILRAVIDVPGAAQPLVVWAAHKKALNDVLSQFRRAVETRRIVEDMAAYASENPAHTQWVMLGDLNADFFTQTQVAGFSEEFYDFYTNWLPNSYVLGADIEWPVLYARYPDDRYAEAELPLSRVPMTQPGGYGTYSFVNAQFISRLDYIYVSPSLADRNPFGEIYYTPMDGPHAGLPKAGHPLKPTKSLISSDHLPVFVDLYLDP